MMAGSRVFRVRPPDDVLRVDGVAGVESGGRAGGVSGNDCGRGEGEGVEMRSGLLSRRT
jgi:hypothetical protein